MEVAHILQVTRQMTILMILILVGLLLLLLPLQQVNQVKISFLNRQLHLSFLNQQLHLSFLNRLLVPLPLLQLRPKAIWVASRTFSVMLVLVQLLLLLLPLLKLLLLPLPLPTSPTVRCKRMIYLETRF
jgi:hypothetical protein